MCPQERKIMKSHTLSMEQQAPRLCRMASSQRVSNCTDLYKDGISKAGGLDLASLIPLKNPTSQ